MTHTFDLGVSTTPQPETNLDVQDCKTSLTERSAQVSFASGLPRPLSRKAAFLETV